MAKEIRVEVSVKGCPALKKLTMAKKMIETASYILDKKIKPEFNRYDFFSTEANAGMKKETEKLYIYANVEIEKERELAKEICEMCDVLADKISEYNNMILFEISKAPEKKTLLKEKN